MTNNGEPIFMITFKVAWASCPSNVF